MVLSRAVIFLGSAVFFGAGAVRAQSEPDYEHAPIRYSATAPRDALTRLQSRLAAGEFTLAGGELRMLQALLTELGVSADSQTLVFSRTSFQRSRIRPDQPRGNQDQHKRGCDAHPCFEIGGLPEMQLP